VTGNYFSCALTIKGSVKCWGENRSGQLGNGTYINRSTPVDVVGLSSGIIALAAGGGYACAVTTKGRVKCWGNNRYGELGDGTTRNSSTPVDVMVLSTGIVALAAGGGHTCALTSLGGVWCWGLNTTGQLGDGTTINRLKPVEVLDLSTGVTALAAGLNHTCALINGGWVKCWGLNEEGQLGDGSRINRSTPGDVVGLSKGVTALATGGWHTCALTGDNGVKCWGHVVVGHLGDGKTLLSRIPVNVVGLPSGVTTLAAGEVHTCALTISGGVKCWGFNYNGELGDGTSLERSTVVDVVRLSRGVTALAAGGDHTCALTGAGRVMCWGFNGQGQLGDGTQDTRTAPVDVVGLFDDGPN
jgi:alpha-tubulin suppressor-like RCC1 family protein